MSSSAYLEATYASPSNAPLHLSTKLPFPSPSGASDDRDSASSLSLSVEHKTAYLRSLRLATAALQERVNAELTARMDEDNRRIQEDRQSGVGNSGAKENGGRGQEGKKITKNQGVVDEAAEEENYGEEVQGEDDEE